MKDKNYDEDAINATRAAVEEELSEVEEQL
jgi:hypothetical protein